MTSVALSSTPLHTNTTASVLVGTQPHSSAETSPTNHVEQCCTPKKPFCRDRPMSTQNVGTTRSERIGNLARLAPRLTSTNVFRTMSTSCCSLKTSKNLHMTAMLSDTYARHPQALFLATGARCVGHEPITTDDQKFVMLLNGHDLDIRST